MHNNSIVASIFNFSFKERASWLPNFKKRNFFFFGQALMINDFRSFIKHFFFIKCDGII